MEFTVYGEQVLEHVNQIFEEIDLIRKLEGEQSDVHGNIALGTSSYFSNIMATDLLLMLKTLFPGINLKIHQDKNVNIISDVLLGNLDLGLLQIGVDGENRYYPQEFLKSKLEFHQLFIRPMRMVVGERHPLRSIKNLKMVDLFPYHYVTSKNLDEDLVYQTLKGKGYSNEVWQVNDTGTRSLIANMDSFNVVTDWGLTVGNQQYQEKLYPLDIQDFFGAYAVGWIHKPYPLCMAEEKIIDLLEQQVTAYEKADKN